MIGPGTCLERAASSTNQRYGRLSSFRFHLRVEGRAAPSLGGWRLCAKAHGDLT
jgi:hypothetical protein